jgi:hypothetical protein
VEAGGDRNGEYGLITTAPFFTFQTLQLARPPHVSLHQPPLYLTAPKENMFDIVFKCFELMHYTLRTYGSSRVL